MSEKMIELPELEGLSIETSYSDRLTAIRIRECQLIAALRESREKDEKFSYFERLANEQKERFEARLDQLLNPVGERPTKEYATHPTGAKVGFYWAEPADAYIDFLLAQVNSKDEKIRQIQEMWDFQADLIAQRDKRIAECELELRTIQKRIDGLK